MLPFAAECNTECSCTKTKGYPRAFNSTHLTVLQKCYLNLGNTYIPPGDLQASLNYSVPVSNVVVSNGIAVFFQQLTCKLLMS